MKPYIIAHRGASFLAKHENTLESFSLAIDINSDYAEMDVRQTRDKKLIVYHDNTFNSTPISYINYNDMLTETRKLGYEVPLFENVLYFCAGKIKLDIELKESGYEKDVIALVTSLYNYDQFMIKSFKDCVVSTINSIDSNIKTGLLIGLKKNSIRGRLSEIFPIRRIRACQANFISPYYKLCSRNYIMRMKHNNLDIYPWTVNKASTISRLIEKGVDGIITDRPDAALFIKKGYNIITQNK